MDYFKRYILFLALCVSVIGCVKEPIYPVPKVAFEVDWSGISAVGGADGQTDSVYVYLYPKFDYFSEPIVIKSFSDELTYSLMPGQYTLMMHNAPLKNLRSGYVDSYDKFTFYMPFDNNKRIETSGKLHLLAPDDKMHTINVTALEKNTFVLKPITATKTIRFKITTARFGDIVSAYGVLSGVVSSMNAKTWALSEADISTIKLPNFTIQDSTLTGGQVDVLGFNPLASPLQSERVILTLYVNNKEVDTPLEQDIDLTDYLKEVKGDEIEVIVTLPFKPATNAVVVINEWLAGDDITVDIS